MIQTNLQFQSVELEAWGILVVRFWIWSKSRTQFLMTYGTRQEKAHAV